MADRSGIEWTDATWNPVRAIDRATGRAGWHCTHVSEGCRFCYAEVMNRRLGTGLAYKPGHEQVLEIVVAEPALLQPLRWRRPRMIFVGSMTDIFADFVTDAMLDRIFAVMAACPQHTFQCLTKRPDRMRAYLSDPGLPKRLARTWCHVGRHTNNGWTTLAWRAKGVDSVPARWPLPNVWLGISAENQPTAAARIPDLQATLAAVRFVSGEPLLGPIDFTSVVCPNGCSPPEYCNRCYPDGKPGTGTFDALAGGEINWIIVGGESGPGARPMHPDWARSIRDQCAAAGVPFFFKQWGEWLPWRQFEGTGIDDDAEQTRFRTSELEDGRWRDAGFPMWFDISDGHVDDEHCVARVGKRRAGRLLDGIEHNGMPCREHALG